MQKKANVDFLMELIEILKPDLINPSGNFTSDIEKKDTPEVEAGLITETMNSRDGWIGDIFQRLIEDYNEEFFDIDEPFQFHELISKKNTIEQNAVLLRNLFNNSIQWHALLTSRQRGDRIFRARRTIEMMNEILESRTSGTAKSASKAKKSKKSIFKDVEQEIRYLHQDIFEYFGFCTRPYKIS